MMEINYEAQSVVEPDEITYMPIDDGLADVWIRKAIHEEEVHTEEYEGIMWFWRETYVRTDKSYEDISAHKNEYFFNPPEYVPYTPPTIDERVQMNEDAIIELAELISYMLEV